MIKCIRQPAQKQFDLNLSIVHVILKFYNFLLKKHYPVLTYLEKKRAITLIVRWQWYSTNSAKVKMRVIKCIWSLAYVDGCKKNSGLIGCLLLYVPLKKVSFICTLPLPAESCKLNVKVKALEQEGILAVLFVRLQCSWQVRRSKGVF